MRKYLSLALLPAGLAAASLAFAGAQAPTAPQPPSSNMQPLPPAQSPPVDDATLIKYDQAYFAVGKLRKEYAPQIQAAATDNEKAQVKQQERKAAEAAIAQYMPVSQFMQIRRQMRNDPALKARARNLAREQGKGNSPPGSGLE
jgi:hypothetical protein